jgi:hypothetical protein
VTHGSISNNKARIVLRSAPAYIFLPARAVSRQ